MSSQYDGDGNRIRVDHPDGAYFTYEYDGLDRPVLQRELGTQVLASFAYDPAGRRLGQGYAGASTGYGYDNIGRLASLTHDLAGTSGDQALGFAYNPASQIVTRTSSNDAYASNTAYNVSRNYSVNGLNQYTAAGPATFGYDANGNLISDGSSTFVYDAENRLVSASGAKTASLVYDPLGRLFQTSVGGAGVKQFLYDGDALIGEYDTAGTMNRRYVHGSDAGVDDPLIWYEYPVSGWRRGLFADHQGSIIAVTDLSGNPVATNGYDAWGIPNAANQGRFQYTGQAWLPELGMYYYKARIYSPTLGRFLQTDPIGYDDQINLYAYVGNDPVNNTDPTGECTGSAFSNAAGECTTGAGVGVSARAAAVGTGSERARGEYNRRTAGLHPDDSAGRDAAKAKARAATPREIRAIIEARRPGLGPKPGSGGRANVTNPRVNSGARALGAAGRGAAVIGVAIAAQDIATSTNRTRATVANITAGVGGFLGGAGGAIAGTFGGPAAPVTVPAGAVAGAAVGGAIAYRLGEKIYDFFSGD